MEELQIVKYENTDISTWNIDQIKEQLAKELEYYTDVVYTDDSFKSAKEDRAVLNKAKKVIDDARKAYKAKCLEPYEAMEKRIKELLDMVEVQRKHIDEKVKEFESDQKAEKEKLIREYYDSKSGTLGEMADRLYKAILDKNSKWLNASGPKGKTLEKAIWQEIIRVQGEVDKIKNMNSVFLDKLLDEYVDTLSIEAVEKTENELKSVLDSAGVTSDGIVEKAEEPMAQIKESGRIEQKEKGEIILALNATQTQLDQLVDFMKAIGITYELRWLQLGPDK